MDNYKKVRFDEFSKIFSADKYKWTTTQPDHWHQAHIRWIIDTETKEFVGYRKTSSWGANDHWGVSIKLLSRKIQARLKREARKSKKKWARIMRKTPVIPYESESPGLMEFVENTNMIRYDPTKSIDEFQTIIKTIWEKEKT
jgi:hypothetical protein